MVTTSGPVLSSTMERHRNLIAYWLLGLLNNTPYVIMIAGAKEIHSGGVGLVYLADIVPAALAKFSAPFWFPHVSYGVRACLAACLMAAALLTVSCTDALWLQLLGVGFCSLQSGIGEASSLALTSLYHGPSTITAWSSGTGFAGVMGYTWVYVFHNLMGLSFGRTLLVALVLPLGWLLVFFVGLEAPDSYRVINQVNAELGQGADVEDEDDYYGEDEDEDESMVFSYSEEPLALNSRGADERRRAVTTSDGVTGGEKMSLAAKGKLFRQLWPYVIPLITVYFAEYAMQSGVWSAIGFPMSSEEARRHFYTFANWAYQAGVFVSRSSGLFLPPSMALLWAMPLLQVCLLVFFIVDAMLHFWLNHALLLLCFVAGLLGGAVYVSGFTLISRHTKDEHRAMALAMASVSDTLGIMLSDVGGLLLQGCIYRANDIPGATFSCGAKRA